MIFNKYQKKQAIDYVNSLFYKDKTVNIVEVANKRNLNQNALYWLYLTCISCETGNDKDLLHDYFRFKFLPVTNETFNGKELTKLTSTTKLDKKNFNEYLDKLVVYCLDELDIILPNPEDKNFETFYSTYSNYGIK